jgi:hypothetical protein
VALPHKPVEKGKMDQPPWKAIGYIYQSHHTDLRTQQFHCQGNAHLNPSTDMCNTIKNGHNPETIQTYVKGTLAWTNVCS